MLFAQEKTAPVAPKQTKYDTNKFSQMYDLLATPNMFRLLERQVQLIISNKQITRSM
jgi:predicted thioesterase